MKPKQFDKTNTIFAADQPEYLPLPAYKDKQGKVTTCWQLSFREHLRILFIGEIWLSLLTFNEPLQPVKMNTKCPL